MDVPRVIAGVFSGSAALILLYQGHITEGGMIVSAMMGFFVGEHNGQKAVAAKATS